MAHLPHNESTARTFMDTLTALYTRAPEAHKQQIANALLEEIFKREIAHIEGPTYMTVSFWEHLEEKLVATPVA